MLHVYVAFDWGEDINLTAAGSRIASEWHPLPRKARTPSSISYRPLPLRVRLGSRQLDIPGLSGSTFEMDATIFDFGAVSVAMHITFELSPAALQEVAGRLMQPVEFVEAARIAAEPVYQSLLAEIQHPHWSDLGEDYFVFQIFPMTDISLSQMLVTHHSAWLASLVRLEAGPLSPEEVSEALRIRLSYGPEDLLLMDWAAAVLIDQNCDETLEVISFANLQLLEFREIDRKLDTRLQTAYGLIRHLARSALPFWRGHSRPLRKLGELKVEANEMLDRSTNVLKLIGDLYLARVYRMLVTRFHLDAWGESIRRSLDVLQSIYQMLSDQAATYRAESLEGVVVFLILLEIILAFLRH
jgi:hypothetical protein